MVRGIAITIALGAVGVAMALGVGLRGNDEGARCGAGFAVSGARCVIVGVTCPAPLEATAHGCDAPETGGTISAPAGAIGASDGEAEGRLRPPTFRVQAFDIDVFEVTRGRWGSLRDAPDREA